MIRFRDGMVAAGIFWVAEQNDRQARRLQI
jgi:hypothetical protein